MEATNKRRMQRSVVYAAKRIKLWMGGITKDGEVHEIKFLNALNEQARRKEVKTA
jgi:hypothetical protein